MIINGTQVNFDRIVRVTLWYGQAPASTTSTDTVTPQTVILEYAPLDNPLFCPNIEAKITDITNPLNKNGQAGWTAEVTLTNPDDASRRIIANHMNWIMGDSTFKDFLKKLEAADSFEQLNEESDDLLTKYYENRVHIRVEAGYWEKTGQLIYDANGNVIGDTRRAYTTLFQGIVNSSVFYRKGVDDIMTLECHNFDTNQINLNAIKQSVGLRQSVENNMEMYYLMAEDERNKHNGRDAWTWDLMAQKLIRNFSTTRPDPDYKTNSTIRNYTPVRLVSSADRKRTDWYAVKYIYTPRDKDRENNELRVRLQNLDTSRFYTVAATLTDMLSDLANWKDANVSFMIDDEYRKGRRVLFVWPRGEEIKFTSAKEADIQIVNYQNLLESPAVNGSGSLNIRMMLNPECKPLRSLALRLDDSFGLDQATGDSSVIRANQGLRESVSFAGNPSPMVAAVQGAYALSIYSQQIGREDVQNKGYLFNIGFPILRCTHTIQTRGNKWETQVQTIPMATGIVVE